MKKFFILMAMALPVCLFSACGDDDDGGGASAGGSISSGATEIADDNGKALRLVSDGMFSYLYDSENRLTSLTYGSAVYPITPEPFKMLIEDGGDKAEITADFNDKGYMSKMVADYSYKDEYMSSTGQIVYNFQYDSSSKLIKVTGNATEKVNEEGYKYSCSGSLDFTPKWNGDVLMGYDGISKGKDDGESYTETMKITYSYGSDVANKYRQYTHALKFFEVDPFQMFATVGLLGKTSSKLPTSGDSEYEEKYSGEDPYTEKEHHEFAYSFNSNGTVAVETIDKYTKYVYTYSDNNSAKIAPYAAVVGAEKMDVKKLVSSFRISKRRHHVSK